jgi:cellulose synthase/poly-beta-1,6-N-acetylglucosamine synthase-like glycosyltransferase
MNRPSYSVVIACDRTDKKLGSLESLLHLPQEDRPSEILLSMGRNPSQQRNLGVQACKSPFVYFLDDDSEVIAGTPRHLVSHFEDDRTAVAGGPNLCRPDASAFEKTISAVLASWLGSFKVRSRYAAIGSVKEATEKELILCNMMVRRETFTAEGGFRKDLYPNEENEFLNRLLHSQFRLVYDPSAAVFRPRRKSLWAFCYQAFRYGRGRAQQIRVYPCLSDVVHFVPTFFLFYALSLALPLFIPGLPPALSSILISPLWRLPFVLFLLLAFGTGISGVSWHRNWWDLLGVPFLIFLRHIFYGVGLIAGFFTPLSKPESGPIRIFKVLWKGPRYHLKEIILGKKA